MPICIDCNYKHQQSQYMQFAQNAAMLNHASRRMGIVTGMPHLINEVVIPPAPIPPLHYNNQVVTVNGGNVGAINFGNIKEIRVRIEALSQQGEIGVAEALANLTNAILASEEAEEGVKNELLEQVAFLSEQAALSPKERKPGLIKSVLTAFREGVGTVKATAEAWNAVGPLLEGHLGFVA